MAPILLSQRDAVIAVAGTSASGLCSAKGGIWPSVQALITFLTTNIFAHAATLYLAPGADLSLIVFSAFQAILLPVSAGDYALHVLGRYFRRLFKWQIPFGDIFGGFKFEDAATAGAIAISVPLRFVPLLQGRWDSIVHNCQHLVMLDNEMFWHREKWTIEAHRNGLPFTVNGKFYRYVPFLLPPTTKFPGYRNYKISPQSNWLPGIIAVTQLFLSGRSIYNKNRSSLQTLGLSSPYLVVVPYLLMTFINLLANVLVGTYAQIVVLPMKATRIPKPNQILIATRKGEKASRVISLIPKQSSTSFSTLSDEGRGSNAQVATESSSSRVRMRTQPPIPVTSREAVSSSSNPSPVGTEGLTNLTDRRVAEAGNEQERPRLLGEQFQGAFHFNLRLTFAEFNGKEWIPFSRNRTLPTEVGKEYSTEVPVLNLGFIRVVRVELWTSVCHQIYWALRYRKTDPPRRRESDESETEKLRAAEERERGEVAQKAAIFLNQTFINWPNPLPRIIRSIKHRRSSERGIEGSRDAINWNPIKHEIGNTREEEVMELNRWLKANYPEIDINTDDLYKKVKSWKLWKNELGYAKLWNGLMLIAVLTLVIGLLTQFRVGVPSHASWILLWLYGGPVFRSKWLVNHMVHNKPCRSLALWILYEVFRGLGWVIVAVVYCGITLISVELFAEFCGTPISLTPAIWVAIGSIILAVLLLVGLLARYVLHIIGFPIA